MGHFQKESGFSLLLWTKEEAKCSAARDDISKGWVGCLIHSLFASSVGKDIRMIFSPETSLDV